MKVVVVWWNLDDSKKTIESLRRSLKSEGVTAWETVQGLRLKLWISNQVNNLWGAVFLWESADAMTQILPPNRAVELIGYSPTSRFTFDVEAMVDGSCIIAALDKLGLSFEEC